MNKDELTKALKSLSKKELIEIFYQAFERPVNDASGNIHDVIVIGESGYMPADGEHFTEFWALPVQGYGDNYNEPFEEGRCGTCKALIASVGKLAICPVCGDQVECT